MISDQPEPPQHQVQSPKPGLVQGSFVIRDPQGNIKGGGTFGGPATPEQVKAIFGKEV